MVGILISGVTSPRTNNLPKRIILITDPNMNQPDGILYLVLFPVQNFKRPPGLKLNNPENCYSSMTAKIQFTIFTFILFKYYKYRILCSLFSFCLKTFSLTLTTFEVCAKKM